MTNISIRTSANSRKIAAVKEWLELVETSAKQTLEHIKIDTLGLCINFDAYESVVSQPVHEQAMVHIDIDGHQSLVELLSFVPRHSAPLTFNLRVTKSNGSPESVYGPLSVRFDVGKSVSQSWREIAQIVGFHSVLCLRCVSPPLLPLQIERPPQDFVKPPGALRSLTKRVFNKITGRSRHRKQWSIGLVDLPTPEQDFFSIQSSDVRWIDVPTDRFWADPQLYVFEKQLYLFYEELIYSENVGKLFVVPLHGTDQLLVGNPIAIDLFPPVAQHLSFPNVFDYEDSLWMIPECASSGKTLLYQCTHFPAKWQLHSILLDHVCGIDPVIHCSEGLVFLFVGDGRLGNWDNNLRLFFANSLFSEFVEHPQSPIALGLDGARMAGKLINQNGKLFRVAQNCSIRYGGSIEVFEITKITRYEYEECHTRSITPDTNGQYPLGLHTLSVNRENAILAIDGLRSTKAR
jgi:hypothetical protein